jgi:hypothetical protein
VTKIKEGLGNSDGIVIVSTYAYEQADSILIKPYELESGPESKFAKASNGDSLFEMN